MKSESGVLPTNLPDLLPAMTGKVSGQQNLPGKGQKTPDASRSPERQSTMPGDINDVDNIMANTAKLVSKLALHTAWDESSIPQSSEN